MVKSFLDYPTVYLSLQGAMGAMRARRICIQEYARPLEGERVLDVGCGPGFVVEYMPQVQYVGVDIESRYIDYAKKRYGDRGEFHCVHLTDQNAPQFGKFDLIMLNGLLHHIDDEGLKILLGLLSRLLNDAGRLVTLDGCVYENMSPISRFLLKHDRGKFVRREADYLAIVNREFSSVAWTHRNDLFRVPYDALVMTCKTPVRQKDEESNRG